MYVRTEGSEEIIYKLDDFMLNKDSKTIYGKYKIHMSNMEENVSKKFFTQIKNNKIIDLMILEKELLDL